MTTIADDAARFGLTEATVQAGDLSFGYLTVEGAPVDAPLALCMHGYPDTAFTWRHLLPRLAAAGFRPVAPFQRGYAPTGPAPDCRYQSGVLALDVNALHQALGGDDRAVLIGHDWGALAAYGAVALEPARWRRLVTLAIPPGPAVAGGLFSYDQLRRSWYMWLNLTPLADLVVPADDFAFIDRLWRDWSPGFDPTEDVARFARSMEGGARIADALAYYRQTLDGLQQDPELADAQAATLSPPTIPTLFLHGSEDGCMGADLAEGAEDHLPEGSRALIVPGTGHFLHLERPAEVDAEILAFLDG